jgi:S-adenosylmethionine hydrolase
MTVITLLTDFGMQDGYPGVMKGVIWGIAPNVQIADISHSIQPQDILEAAIVLARTATFFPSATIHVAVVDPGVGTARRPIGLKLGEHFFIGPDNGLFTLVLDLAEANHEDIQIIQLDKRKYWLPEISNVFHGRDIFAPCAAHLAMGIALQEMGTIITDPVRLSIPQPKPTDSGGWWGQIIHIDHFGNLSTNLHAGHIDDTENVIISIREEQITGLVSTYGERPPGTLIAVLDSSGAMAISVVNGSAAQLLNAHIGDTVEINFKKII